MKTLNLLLLVSLLSLFGCSSSASSFNKNEVSLIRVEGCGLDQSHNTKLSNCEKELSIKNNKEIEVFLRALENGHMTDEPLTSEGNNFDFTIVEKDDTETQYQIWIKENKGSFAESSENTRHIFQDEDVKKISNIIEEKLKNR